MAGVPDPWTATPEEIEAYLRPGEPFAGLRAVGLRWAKAHYGEERSRLARVEATAAAYEPEYATGGVICPGALVSNGPDGCEVFVGGDGFRVKSFTLTRADCAGLPCDTPVTLGGPLSKFEMSMDLRSVTVGLVNRLRLAVPGDQARFCDYLIAHGMDAGEAVGFVRGYMRGDL